MPVFVLFNVNTTEISGEDSLHTLILIFFTNPSSMVPSSQEIESSQMEKFQDCTVRVDLLQWFWTISI